MLPEILALSPAPPLLASLILAIGLLTGRVQGELSERFTVRLSLSAMAMATGFIGLAGLLRLTGHLPNETILLGNWLNSGEYRIDWEFSLDGLGLVYAGLSCFFALSVMRFSSNYLHREAGFHRFFLLLNLFAGAMLLLATAGNAALGFAAWELAGVSSYLLIGYQHERKTAVANATRAFLTNRVGDAGFIVGIALAFLWTGGIRWQTINAESAHLLGWQAGVLAVAFLLAASAKSALLPFSSWLARAMEGPTPSSALFYGAVMVHAGVFLLLRLQGLFEHAPAGMTALLVVGALTAVYGFVCGWVQTDVKSALAFSTTAQVGLMLVSAGLGFWQFVLWHLCSHGLLRGYQFLSAPSLMHQIEKIPQRRVPAKFARLTGLYVAALQRFWLEPMTDAITVKPVDALAADANAFDRQVVDPLLGLPVSNTVNTPGFIGQAAWRQGLSGLSPEVQNVSGLAGWLVRQCANACHWFEEKLVLRSVSHNLLALGRQAGVALNQVERLLNQPRYWVIFVIASLLFVL